jgi:hypothetical protein
MQGARCLAHGGQVCGRLATQNRARLRQVRRDDRRERQQVGAHALHSGFGQ